MASVATTHSLLYSGTLAQTKWHKLGKTLDCVRCGGGAHVWELWELLLGVRMTFDGGGGGGASEGQRQGGSHLKIDQFSSAFQTESTLWGNPIAKYQEA